MILTLREVEWFCITKRICGKDSPNAWDRIKEDKDVAVAERGEELVLEGDETKGSPCDSNMATTLLLVEWLICLTHGNYSKNHWEAQVTTLLQHWIKHAKSCRTHQNGWTLYALDHVKMHTGSRAWWILVRAHLAHTAGQQGETSTPCC